jgi:hypothetical protein
MKCSLAAIIFFMLPFSLFAQYSIGIKASPVIAGNWNYSIGNIDENTTVSGLNWALANYGVFFNYAFRENFSIQTEIKIFDEHFGYDVGDETKNVWFHFTFAEIPLLFQFRGKNSFCGFAEAGLALKFLISAKHTYHEDPYEKYNARNYFNNVVLKGNAGGGIIFDISRHLTFIASTRLGYDFTPIGQKNTVDKINKEFTFNNIHLFHFTLISFGIAYKF